VFGARPAPAAARHLSLEGGLVDGPRQRHEVAALKLSVVECRQQPSEDGRDEARQQGGAEIRTDVEMTSSRPRLFLTGQTNVVGLTAETYDKLKQSSFLSLPV